MTRAASLLNAELLKVHKRWMPYVLALPVIAALSFQTFFGYFVIWRDERGIEGLRVSVLPWSLPSLLDLTQYLGAIVLGVLAASAVGTEYGWGTVRQAISRGQPRAQFLAVKLGALMVAGLVGFLLVFGVAIVFSIAVTLAEGRSAWGRLAETERIWGKS